MYHITVSPDTFELTKSQDNQNPYIDISIRVNTNRAKEQHDELLEELDQNVHYRIRTKSHIPDMVFVASLGLSLPRLPEAVVVLPNMVFDSRKRELKYAKGIFEDLHIKTYALPTKAPFEGQGETKWFDGGELLVVGYGFRSTKQTVTDLRTLLTEIYDSYGVKPPKVVGVKLRSPDFYHLDMAMMAYSPTGAILQERAFTQSTVDRLKREIGTITVIETDDRFALNVIIEPTKIICHTLTDPIRALFEKITGLPVVQVETSEFEKSGGSVRCLVFDVFDPRMVKRKFHSKTPSSPTSPRR